MRLLSSIFPQHSLSYKMPLRFNNLDIGGGFPLLQNAPSFSTTVSYKDIPFDKPAWSSSCHATKCHCDFHEGLTWLKWLLYKTRFTSLNYKILGLDFISGLAWLKWKPLYSACGNKLCSLKSQGDIYIYTNIPQKKLDSCWKANIIDKPLRELSRMVRMWLEGLEWAMGLDSDTWKCIHCEMPQIGGLPCSVLWHATFWSFWWLVDPCCILNKNNL